MSENYINLLNNKNFVTTEPYVVEYLQQSKNIKFTTNLKLALENDIIFVVVRTPSTPDWKYNPTDIENIASQLINLGRQEKQNNFYNII